MYLYMCVYALQRTCKYIHITTLNIRVHIRRTTLNVVAVNDDVYIYVYALKRTCKKIGRTTRNNIHVDIYV